MLDHLDIPARGSAKPAALTRVRGRVRRATSKASLVEYGLLLAAIVSVLVLVCFALGSYVSGALNTSCDPTKTGTVTAAAASSCPSR